MREQEGDKFEIQNFEERIQSGSDVNREILKAKANK
jgi:hypothetical protein